MASSSKNHIYNQGFKLALQDADFPDGWLKAGGTAQTQWIWEKHPCTPGGIKIINPVDVKAGIRQNFSVHVPIGERQRWQVGVSVHSEQPELPIYIRIVFSNPAGYPISALYFKHITSLEISEYTNILMTPEGAAAAVVETGVVGAGTIFISEISLLRLYPLKRLRMDEKGRIFVNDVATVQKIVEPIRIKDPVHVNIKAKVEADIRDLNFMHDSVRIFGSENLPVKTNHLGQAQVEIVGNSFINKDEKVKTADDWTLSAQQDVSRLKVYSFAILNTGPAPATVRLSISPDGINWVFIGPTITVGIGELEVLAPSIFLHFISLGYRSKSSGSGTTLSIWFQAQS
ncbi:DUF6385 domain-containing protein [Dethiobacter alkaliphilus]|uniref:DUF6385 domain-containing protein n=1 Tax=Dethiobacter alkaliphilus TaxID=427926 RepID=UPI0022279E58|nr:DUF6385 domain-containing protein [Dethiobacter alkaliphilus]MCW3489268.1 DUF6385 domain-containing protein [Dethiobacter alkaliphilus]